MISTMSLAARTVYVPKQPQKPIAVDVGEVTAKPIAALTSSGMVATAVAPGHGYQTGQAVSSTGVRSRAGHG